MKEKITVFYSWQSDLPGKNNRYLIQSSIEKAVKNLNKKAITISADRDTCGKLGTPDIVETIFNKIDEADIFVADISIINSGSSAKKTPNPNVLLELGYAAKSLGWERIICIINSDYGLHEDLPFDLKTRRILSYSSVDTEKSEIKDKISSIIEMTVENLISSDMIPVKNTEVQNSKKILANLVRIGIDKAWTCYYKREMDIFDDILEENFAVVTDAHFNMIETISSYINQEQYFLLHEMLDLLQKMRKGTEDVYGWEYASLFVERYFESIYLEYFPVMNKVKLMNALKEDVLNAYNCLLMNDEKIEYKSSRYSADGNLIFQVEPYHQEAYDKENNLLCKVDLDNKGLISGWKKTDDYVGEYKNGYKHGKGIEYAIDFNYKTFKKKEGYWMNDEFIEGKIQGVIIYYDEGQYTWIPDDNELPQTKDWLYLRGMFRSEGPSDCKDYYFTDMTLKNGEYEIIEGTVKPICSQLGGTLDCFCDECEYG